MPYYIIANKRGFLYLGSRGIRGVAKDWFRFYLDNQKQHVTPNGSNSSIKPILTEMPQGYVLGPLLFLIYINDLCKCVKYSETYHFADDTNMLQSHSSLETLVKRMSLDLKSLSQWLRANKLSLNVTKTELIIFHSSSKKTDHSLKLKLDGKSGCGFDSSCNHLQLFLTVFLVAALTLRVRTVF